MADFITYFVYGVKINDKTFDEIINAIDLYFKENSTSYALNECASYMDVITPNQDDIRDWLYDKSFLFEGSDSNGYYLGRSFYIIEDGDNAFEEPLDNILNNDLHNNSFVAIDEIIEKIFNQYQKKNYLIRVCY